MKKIFLSFLFIVSLSFSFISCDPSFPYKGERYDLLSEIINSDPFVDGMSWRNAAAPILEVKETDSFGRTLFLYFENKYVNKYYMVVSQQTKDGYVYYYPDYNYITAIGNNFILSDVDNLKEINDWGKEINLDKCIKTKVLNQKEVLKIRKPANGNHIEEILFSDENPHANIYTFNQDVYGRTLLLLRRNKDYTYWLLIVNPDKNITVDTPKMEITNKINYQDELKAFKELNNWNKPFDETQS